MEFRFLQRAANLTIGGTQPGMFFRGEAGQRWYNKPGGRTSGQPPVFITVRRGLVLIGMLVYRISTHCIRRRNISGSLLR